MINWDKIFEQISLKRTKAMILVNTLLKTQRRNLNILYKIVKRYEQTVYFKKYKVALTHVKRSSASLIIRKN